MEFGLKKYKKVKIADQTQLLEPVFDLFPMPLEESL